MFQKPYFLYIWNKWSTRPNYHGKIKIWQSITRFSIVGCLSPLVAWVSLLITLSRVWVGDFPREVGDFLQGKSYFPHFLLFPSSVFWFFVSLLITTVHNHHHPHFQTFLISKPIFPNPLCISRLIPITHYREISRIPHNNLKPLLPNPKQNPIPADHSMTFFNCSPFDIAP